ncbi:MAG TPA: hypothetical protein EYN24_08015 [Gammaproteobacteria bacterium]|nr:hypothetical protein [Gammaproteobacteria bacterium]HIO34459.1 hypothetical protein [Gammaproteobacteria bacterium]
MTGQNVLVIVSDEHTREALGCYGADHMHTPNIDGLARRGTRFSHAYTPSPICVPARACIATGTYVHQNRCWSNAQPYHGQVTGWGHRLIENGHRVVSVGKLHHRSSRDDNGFDTEIMPLHVKDGIGWARGLLGRNGSSWDAAAHFAEEIGPGLCDYNQYDMEISAAACQWLRHEATKDPEKPWVLYASFVSPHYPLIVPQRYFDLYPPSQIEPPRLNTPTDHSEHPVLQAMRHYLNYDDFFDDQSRQVAKASYLGLCSFLDDHVGALIDALHDSGQYDNTLIIYTSDHGEMAGNHGLWTKCVMYEESAGIPLILSGPSVPKGEVRSTQASLVDLHPTILQATGLGLSRDDLDLPGCSLLDLIDGETPNRLVLSEYHDGGSITGMFMIRREQFKYVCYPGYPPQLFDLEKDPYESTDLAPEAAYQQEVQACHQALCTLVDPERANELAFSDQSTRISELGGRKAIESMENFDQSPVPH